MRAALLLLAGCAVGATEPTSLRPLDGAISHTMLLSNPGCTGVRIGGGLVVTARHCMGPRKVGDEDTGMQVGYISPLYDFAVLSGDSVYAPVALEDARIGEHVYVVGYPVSIDDGKQHLTITDGVYTGVETDTHLSRITAHAYYGNSGGGCWNDSGELVGILVEIRPLKVEEGKPPLPFPASSYMVPIRLVRDIVLSGP